MNSDALEKDSIFGRHVFVHRVTEFQKCYLPHAHIALRLDIPDPIPEMVDSWIPLPATPVLDLRPVSEYFL